MEINQEAIIQEYHSRTVKMKDLRSEISEKQRYLETQEAQRRTLLNQLRPLAPLQPGDKVMVIKGKLVGSFPKYSHVDDGPFMVHTVTVRVSVKKNEPVFRYKLAKIKKDGTMSSHKYRQGTPFDLEELIPLIDNIDDEPQST